TAGSWRPVGLSSVTPFSGAAGWVCSFSSLAGVAFGRVMPFGAPAAGAAPVGAAGSVIPGFAGVAGFTDSSGALGVIGIGSSGAAVPGSVTGVGAAGLASAGIGTGRVGAPGTVTGAGAVGAAAGGVGTGSGVSLTGAGTGACGGWADTYFAKPTMPRPSIARHAT